MARSPKVPPARRQGRMLALQALYEMDASRHTPEASLAWLEQDQQVTPETMEFARELVQGVHTNKAGLDDLIRQYAPVFPVAQLSIVDRSILRLAIYEIQFSTATPAKAAINEAVELAKMFGSESSPRFVNGVLGSVMGGHGDGANADPA